jgi:hypothetical protein
MTMMTMTISKCIHHRYDRATKMPPLHKPNQQNTNQSGIGKNYSPAKWEEYFD